MKKTDFVNKMSRSFHKIGFQCKKHSPEILVAAGVVGTVASAVMACKATTKINDILEDHKDQVDFIHESVEKEQVKGVPYTEEDGKKDVALVYTQTAVKLVKLYAPSVALGALSLTAIVSSHNILRKRNVALAAAYATIDKGFKEYRGRVIERFGKELDRELKYNIKAKEIEEKVVDENGEEKTVTKTVSVADPNQHSDYARFFDDGCTGWSKDAEYNLTFLKMQQAFANETLKRKGYLFLNDVYDMLGIPKTQAGQVVGWIYDEKHPIGDNFVDFGIYDLYNEKARDFVNGYERTILLDFNVDGNILHLMP
jgi:hypothetical protein